MNKKKPAHWRKSNNTLSLPNGSLLELAELSVNMNKGFQLPAEYETCLAGKYGELWTSKHDEAGQPIEFKVVFISTNKSRKAAKLLGKDLICKAGDEPILTFPKNMLYAFVLLLGLPKSPGTRARYANEHFK